MADYEGHGNTNYRHNPDDDPDNDNWEDYQEYADHDYDYDEEWPAEDHPAENAQAEREPDPWHENGGDDPWTSSDLGRCRK